MTNTANSANRLGLRAKCVALAFLLATLGAVPGYGADESRSGTADRCTGADCAAPSGRGLTVYRGLVLDYDVIDGMAVHDGDMVLGTAEDAAAAAPSREAVDAERSGRPARRDLAPADGRLWPDGRVPYVIADGLDDRHLRNIRAAIEEWNSKTVISLFPRTDEDAFVAFVPSSRPFCAAQVGYRSGTATEVYMSPGCDQRAVIHEIGHAVGLYHEHQRADRDRFLVVTPESTARNSQWVVGYRPSGPYNYRSVMHYQTFGAFSIPPGIPIAQDSGVSPGDIDGVAWLYGQPPVTITISTNPPGLEVIVDGDSVVTPATFEWLPGGVHTLEAFVELDDGLDAVVFGRWNDDGARRRVVSVGDSTWYEANYIPVARSRDAVLPDARSTAGGPVRNRYHLYAEAAGPGAIEVSPESEDGFYESGSQVQLTALPSSGSYFVGWEHALSGTERSRSVILDRDWLAAARFSDVEPVLVPFGEPVQADSLTGRHFVRVPDGTSEVAVRFGSSAATPVGGYVTDGSGSRRLGDTSFGESDTITITREELSRMDNEAPLFPSGRSRHLRIWDQVSAWSGELHVSVRRDWIAGVWPPALTFVSSAGSSSPVSGSIRITPVQGEIPYVRYRIVSDRHWLEAFPPEWASGQGGVEIRVRANGASLAPDAYGGKLSIETRSDGGPAAGWTPTGIEIPVHFVVKPSRDGSSGRGGVDDHGDTRGTSTEVAVGASARGRLERVGDEDWFRFRTSAASTRVTLYTVSNGDTAGELYPARGAPVSDEDSGSGGNFQITAEVPAGTHYVRVQGVGSPEYELVLETRGPWVGPGVGDAMEFERIPAGSFVMGSPSDEPGRNLTMTGSCRDGFATCTPANHEPILHEGWEPPDEDQHEVRISHEYWIGKYEVTQGQWEAVMGENPSNMSLCGARCPVEGVSWEDVREFIRRLNEQESGSGYVYRLPTEAEWEYAARAGTTGARYGELDEIAWIWPNSSGVREGQLKYRTHPVGQKRANAWGLHDMLGNVWEWTADWYSAYPSGVATDPEGPSAPLALGPKGFEGGVGELSALLLRVIRGGAWAGPSAQARLAQRGKLATFSRSDRVGFRLVRKKVDGAAGLAGEDDHGDTRDAATEVAVGASTHGRLERVGDEDWFRFRTSAASMIAAHTVSEGDTTGELHVAWNTTFLDDDSGSLWNFRSEAIVPPGTHYVRVSGFGTFDYALVLEDLGDPGEAMEFVQVPAGSFVMGSPEGEVGRSDTERQREVRIGNDFWMGKYEVTQGLWESVMGSALRFRLRKDPDDGPRHPAVQSPWAVQTFVKRWNSLASGSGYVYRLPTEAEWEYAARAGTTGARYGALDEIAWYRDNSGGKTHPVGQKQANAWGLHDMLGNATEWTADRWSESGEEQVVKGGSSYDGVSRCRAAFREGYTARSHVGFRLVMTESDEPSSLAAGDDHGDTRDAATEVAVGASARGGLQGVGDEDWFRFRTTAARTRLAAYTVSDGETAGELHTSGRPPVADGYLGTDRLPGRDYRIKASIKKNINTVWVSGLPGHVRVSGLPGMDFRITASVPAGTHYVRVSGFGASAYTLTIEGIGEVEEAMEFVPIPAGSFKMGVDVSRRESPVRPTEGEQDRHRQRDVRITQAFEMGKHEVTQDVWEAVMGDNPSHHHGCGRCPVERVSWEAVQAFISRLNSLASGSGYVYRLPTAAEWEYAARAGTTGWPYAELDSIAWWYRTSGPADWRGTTRGRTTHPVGQKLANAWGLHDMLGNVEEWTASWTDISSISLEFRMYNFLYLTPRELRYFRNTLPAVDPQGPPTGWERVIRGGSFGSSLEELSPGRSGFGISEAAPGFYELNLGFRLVRTQTGEDDRAGDGYGDTREAATEVAAGASRAQGRVVGGDADWFRFRTTAPKTWIAAYTVSEGNTVGELHLAGGGTVADDNSGSGGNFRISAFVPAGTHHLRVSGFGEYALKLEAVPDDRFGTLAVGASAQGRLQTGGAGDFFRFRTTAPSTWITAYTVSEGDTVGELHLAGGGTVADDDPGSGGSFRISAKVPAGTHHLRVSGTADYTLVLKETLDAMEFVRIPAGSFAMGSPLDERGRADDERQHLVRISEGFWMGKYEVTSAQWQALLPNSHRRSSVADCAVCPALPFHLLDLQAFIRELNERESGNGFRYRLPTEAEWEYAARAGVTGPQYGDLDEIAWSYSNSQNSNGLRRARPVGKKLANPWGLHDMLGNVPEWTASRYGEYLSNRATDPQGPATGLSNAVRGGGYYDVPWARDDTLRFAYRRRLARYNPHAHRWLAARAGFRLVRTEAVPDDHGNAQEAVPDDHGDTRDSATLIAVGGSAGGRLQPVGDEDWFRFRTTAARTRVTAYTVSEGDTAGELHDAGGGTVADDDAGGGGDFRVSASVPAGTHYLRVSGRGLGDHYTLILRARTPKGRALDAMEFVRIPAGSFLRGSPAHEVTLSRGFWMGKYEVTQGEWEAIMGFNPSRFADCGPRCPVERITMTGALSFIERLNALALGTGFRYRLPTEAEWEYAARAGTTGARHGELDEIAWHAGNSGETTHPVGQKRTNLWGLHDMVGNVSEWVADWYGEYSGGAVTDPTGPSTGTYRLSRGGSWLVGQSAHSAIRLRTNPDYLSGTTGFRVVRTEAGGSSSFGAEDDHGDTRDSATEIAVGASVRGRVQLVGDDDWFRFQTTAAHTVVTAYTESDGDTLGELHVAGSDSPVTDDDAGIGRNFRISASVPPGTHYLLVGGSTGEYTLTLTPTRTDPVLDAMEFVRIPAGSFLMGSPEDEAGRNVAEGPQREVTISRGFWMGKYEVTRDEWEAVMDPTPDGEDCGRRCPVVGIADSSFYDINPRYREFVWKLNEQQSGKGYHYRLPTEAEWEYAARAGTTGARYGELDEIAWHAGNSGHEAHPVGQKRANPWGLYDMLGNAWEVTADWYGRYPVGAETDPTGPRFNDNSLGKVFRGGSFYMSIASNRSAARTYDTLDHDTGLRLVRTEADWDDHGDTRKVATEAAVGASVHGRLEWVGDQDWFRFRATSATRVTIVADVDTYWELHVAGSHDPVQKKESDSEFVPAGTHYVRVVGFLGTAEYTLTLRDDTRTVAQETVEAMEFVRIPAGSFLMGSPEDEEGRSEFEGPQHEVTIGQGFWMGKYEVTVREWTDVMGSRPPHYSGGDQCPRCPVTDVTGNDVQEFIRKLNQQHSGQGHRYRLPTEAEWEYAARAGTTGARYGEVDEIAWTSRNSRGSTGPRAQPVGKKLANPWGLHDMLGNVWEWTADWFRSYPGADREIDNTGEFRVLRGGSFWSDPVRVRAANRSHIWEPSYREDDIGFRLVRTE